MDLKIVSNFLKELKNNNNKEWFDKNRDVYKKAKMEFEDLINVLIFEVKKIDKEIDVTSAKECMFRIFRDVRFSKNKSPYKTNFGAYIKRGGRKSLYPGYYVHIEPGDSFVAGGIYAPEPAVLKAVRQSVFERTDEFKKILNSTDFRKYSKELYDVKLKMAPRGFPKDFSDVELLKYKHYIVSAPVSDKFWLSPNVITDIKDIFKAQYPLNQFINKAIKEIK